MYFQRTLLDHGPSNREVVIKFAARLQQCATKRRRAIKVPRRALLISRKKKGGKEKNEETPDE